MPNPDRLQITYRPATRDISFSVYEGVTSVGGYECFKKYSSRDKGRFILNLCGEEFFEDILKPFSGKDSVEVSLRTARLDYEDFKQRVEAYNKTTKNSKVILLPLDECDELTDMQTAFCAIKEQGGKIVSIFDAHWIAIQNIPCASGNAKKYLMQIAKKIKAEKERVEKGVQALTKDTTVNLCVIGVHSSGKSTLINTLIGYRILPESIRPETAKMVKITGVPNKDTAFIAFAKKEGEAEKLCRLTWDSHRNRLIIKDTNISDESFNSALQNELDECHECRQDEQFHHVLKFLNDDTSIQAKIDLGFPLPIDSERAQFTIYDTPGSDSHVGYHKEVLHKALASQTNTILLFVLSPNNVSGSGNVYLMNELLGKSQSSGNFIDIEQSFFVYNYADSISNDISFNELKTAALKKEEGDKNPVDLSERKVFFVSALCGFAAMATKNGVASLNETKHFKFKCRESFDEDFGRYYRHNHYGKSNYITDRMREKAENALDAATVKGDDCDKYLISSGIQTLIDEIQNYGERYAAAVKTSALVRSIESAMESVANMVKETRIGTNEKVKDLRTQLELEIKKIHDIIDSISKEYKAKFQDSEKRKEELHKVGCDGTCFLDRVISPVKETLDRKLNGVIFVKVTDQLKQDVRSSLTAIYERYTENYKKRRDDYLKETQEGFIREFMRRVEESELSEETKQILTIFKLPDIPELGLDKKIDELFGSANLFEYKTLKKVVKTIDDFVSTASEKVEKSASNDIHGAETFLEKGLQVSKKTAASALKKTKDFIDGVNENIQDWHTEMINRKQFIGDVEKWLFEKQDAITDAFRKELSESVDRVCSDLSDEFKSNIDGYSTKIRALKEDNEPLEALAVDIGVLETELRDIKTVLDTKI